MIALTTLRKYLEPDVPGCPYALLDRAFLQVARDLCNRTHIWREGSDIAIFPNADLPVDLDTQIADAEILTVEWVKYNNLGLEPTTVAILNAEVPYWKDDTSLIPSHFITNINDKSITLYPIPTATGQLTYEVTIRPAMDATELPDFLTQDFLDLLIDGALARLLNMKKQTWADPAEAERRRINYEHAIIDANAKNVYGLSSYDSAPQAGTLV